MPAPIEAVIQTPADEKRRAIAQHLIASLGRAASTGPVRHVNARPAVARRFMLFATPLVQAILAGRKRVTRRLITPAPRGAPKVPCPYGAAGDRIWVREKWGYRRQFYDRRAASTGPYIYAADGAPEGAEFLPWKPSLHMPRAACRIVLEISAVHSERLRSITANDAIAEGCPNERLDDPIAWFAEVWDRYLGSRGYGWSANPWVWVIGFRMIDSRTMK